MAIRIVQGATGAISRCAHASTNTGGRQSRSTVSALMTN
jgi:hypothetical protein